MVAQLLAGAAAQRVGAKAAEVASYPVIGWKRTAVKTTKTMEITEESSVQIRAWEIAALGIAAAVGFVLLAEDMGIKERQDLDITNIGLVGLLIPPIGIGQAFGVLPQF